MKTFGSVSIGIAGTIVAMLEGPSERTAPPVECRHQGNIERSHLALALAVLAGRDVAHRLLCPISEGSRVQASRRFSTKLSLSQSGAGAGCSPTRRMPRRLK